MAALNVSSYEAALSELAKTEASTIIHEGANAGGQVIAPLITDDTKFNDAKPTMEPYNEAVAISVIRRFTNLPFKLPAYSVSGFNGPVPPAASSYTGALIYVADGAAGQPIVAFSDGTNWLRVDTRAVIS